MNVQIHSEGSPVFGAGCLGFFLVILAAYLTHLVWVIGKLAGAAGVTSGQIVLAVLGSFMPPIGIVHGVMIWFGAGF